MATTMQTAESAVEVKMPPQEAHTKWLEWTGAGGPGMQQGGSEEVKAGQVSPEMANSEKGTCYFEPGSAGGTSVRMQLRYNPDVIRREGLEDDWVERRINLELLAASSVLVVFDWKGFGWEAAAASLLRELGLTARTIVSTSVEAALDRFQAADPDLATGLTVPRLSKRVPPAPLVPALARRRRCQAVMLGKDFVTPATVAAVRDSDLGLFLWTAGSQAELEALRAYGPGRRPAAPHRRCDREGADLAGPEGRLWQRLQLPAFAAVPRVVDAGRPRFLESDPALLAAGEQQAHLAPAKAEAVTQWTRGV